MHRRKEPNLGLWTAPGGKIEVGESPHETARREMSEETGLEIEELHLRGLCTQVSLVPEWQWLQFIFVTTRFHGDVKADRREGDLAWVPLEEYLSLPTPQADARLYDHTCLWPMTLTQSSSTIESPERIDICQSIVP